MATAFRNKTMISAEFLNGQCLVSQHIYINAQLFAFKRKLQDGSRVGISGCSVPLEEARNAGLRLVVYIVQNMLMFLVLTFSYW